MSLTEYRLLDGEDGEVALALVAAARCDRAAVEEFMLQFEAFVRMGRPLLDRVFPAGPIPQTEPAATEIFYVPPRYRQSDAGPMAALVMVDHVARSFRIARIYGPTTPPPDREQLAEFVAATSAEMAKRPR